MSFQVEMSTIGLYFYKKVRVTLDDNSTVIGTMNGFMPGSSIQVDETLFPLDRVEDVECVGKADYHNYRGFGEVEGFPFSAEEFEQSGLSKYLLSGEYECELACHLEYEAGKISAKNIKLFSVRHSLCPAKMINRSFWFVMSDQRVISGEFLGCDETEDNALVKLANGEELQVPAGKMVQVYPIPDRNTHVTIWDKNDTEYNGVVSAVTDTMLVLIGEGTVGMVQVNDIVRVRYTGTASVGRVSTTTGAHKLVLIGIDGAQRQDYLCKQNYLENQEIFDSIVDGDTFSFEPGVNARGFIAKNVILLNKAGETSEATEVPEEEIKGETYKGIGVILSFPNEKKGKKAGYIGSEFMARAYAEQHNLDMPSGNVWFYANALNFEPAPGKIYVVNYECAEEPKDSVQKALSVDVIKSYDYTNCARLRVDEDGEVTFVPFAMIFLSKFLHNDLELTLTSGETLTGFFEKEESDSITLLFNNEEPRDERIILKSEIEKIRYYSVITAYRFENGTGHIGGEFWFHVNSFRDATEVTRIGFGKRVAFSIEASSKGKNNQAIDITIVYEEQLKGMLLGYDGLNCRIVPQDKYGDVDQEKEYAVVVQKSMLEEKLGSLNLRAYAYPIIYVVRRIGFEEKAVINHVDTINRVEKALYGYVLKYVQKPQGGSFGFILEPDLLDAHIKSNDKSGSVYFREKDIVNPSKFTIDTFNKYYYVSYLKGEGNVAINVSILKELEFPTVKKAPAAPVPVTIDVPVTERIDLSEYEATQSEYYGEVTPIYGLVNLATSYYALVNGCYINKTMVEDESYSTNQLAVIFSPSQAKLIGEQMKTNKYSYLVRYVTNGTVFNEKTGMEHPAIDYEYPIEILRMFPKKHCRKITIENNEVIVETLENRVAGVETAHEVVNDGEYDVPEMVPGESVIFRMADGTDEYCVYAGEEDQLYIVNDDIRIPFENVSRIYRFGVVTDFSLEKGVMTLNRALDVPLSIVDAKVINILRSQTNGIRLHVLYSCENDRVVEVDRITDNFAQLIPWTASVIKKVDIQKKAIIVENAAYHYISVLSDGLVNRVYKSNTAAGLPVFAKIVSHPLILEEMSEMDIVESAFEVRLQNESLVVQYDSGHDIYLGYRNATTSYPLNGTYSLLQKYVGEEAEVIFQLDNNNFGLIARLAEDDGFGDDDADNSEENEKATENVLYENLVSFIFEQIDFGRMFLKGVELNENSLPKDIENAQKAFDMLRKNGNNEENSLAAAKIAFIYEDVKLDKDKKRAGQIMKMLLHGVREKCKRIGMDPNLTYGELAYYMTLLLRYPAKPGHRRLEKNMKKGLHFDVPFSHTDCLYQMFLSDFGTREELSNNLQKGNVADSKQLNALLARNCKQIDELISHIVMIDQKSLEKVYSLLEQNEELNSAIREKISQIDDSIKSDGLSDAVSALRDRYKKDKSRFTAALRLLSGNTAVAAGCKELILNMQARFMKMLGHDDRARFEQFLSICFAVCDYVDKPGFSQQEEILRAAYRELSDLEHEMLQHPCKESTEMLLKVVDGDDTRNIIDRLQEEIEGLLNSLYRDEAARPQLECFPNEPVIEKDSKSLWLILQNGSSSQKLQPAENISLNLISYTEGLSVEQTISLKQNKLAAGEQCAVEVAIETDSFTREAASIGWSVSFECAEEFADGRVIKTRHTVDKNSSFDVQFGSMRVINKESFIDQNPYHDAAQGQPLETGTMFFGRKAEKEEILNSIVTVREGKESFVRGSAVIVHGQKKSGKTSLIYQIKNYITGSPELNPSAIILNFNNILDETGGVELLPFFKRNFYANILKRFRREVRKNHPEVLTLLKENEIEIPDIQSPMNNEVWASLFDDFFRDFISVDDNQHTLVLFMDEFTLLCTTIMEEIASSEGKEALASIPNFIKTFSQYGFVQVIIGHEAMMRALDSLKVLNHTAEFARTIEIAALDVESATKLIVEPMETIFGFNPYGTELGRRAVERLLDLSGRNATYLMRLCDQMYDYYVSDRCGHAQLMAQDVDAMVLEFIERLLLTDFDILLVEDGDNIEEPEKRKTYQYLKCNVALSSRSFDGRTADNNQIDNQLREDYGWSAEEIEKTRSVLEARRVISITSGGRVKIITGLFLEYILRKNGGK